MGLSGSFCCLSCFLTLDYEMINITQLELFRQAVREKTGDKNMYTVINIESAIIAAAAALAAGIILVILRHRRA